jgi:hypothetical protein
MSYVHPEKVLSPKDTVRGVRVLYNTGPGENSWSVAEVNWGGDDRVAIRWNGLDGEDGVGNPQSRGHPTWFVVPDPLKEAVLKEVERLSKTGRDQISEGYRAMARDRAREAEAKDWTEGLITDAGDSEG